MSQRYTAVKAVRTRGICNPHWVAHQDTTVPAGEGGLSDLNPDPPRDNRSFEAPFPDRIPRSLVNEGASLAPVIHHW